MKRITIAGSVIAFLSATQPDPDWEPEMTTAPHPDYPVRSIRILQTSDVICVQLLIVKRDVITFYTRHTLFTLLYGDCQ